MKDFPLYSVIDDGVEIGTAGRDDDAQEICGGFDIVFVNEERPKHIEILEQDEDIERIGYYVKVDGSNFKETQLYSDLNNIVSETGFSSIETTNTGDDFREVAIWTLKEMLIKAYNKGLNS